MDSGAASLPAIDHLGLSHYMYELVRQWQAAEDATQFFNQQVLPRRGPEMLRLTFFSLQSLLAAGGMVSKLLWPSPYPSLSSERKAWAVKRGEVLRAELQIGDIPLLRERTVRNALEHFDESLDEWLTDGLGRTIVDFAVMPPSSISIVNQSSQQTYMRLFDPDTFDIWIGGHCLPGKELHNAIYAVGMKAKEWLSANGFQPTFG